MASELLRQLEFYFCDLNLIQDKFLKGVIETSDGWVPVDTVANFSRVLELTKERDEVVKAIKESQELELSEDGNSLKRKTPLPTLEEINSRSVFVKGFPVEATLDEIKTFFNKTAPVTCIRQVLKRKDDKLHFSGNLFVEFETPEMCAKFVVEKPQYNEHALEITPRADSFKSKKEKKFVFVKLTVPAQVNNKDFKSVIKNNEILKENVTKYCVEYLKVERKDKKEKGEKMVEEKAEEKPEEAKKEETKEEEKKEEQAEKKEEAPARTTKYILVAMKNNDKVAEVKQALADLVFHKTKVVLADCNDEDKKMFESFVIPTKACGKRMRKN